MNVCKVRFINSPSLIFYVIEFGIGEEIRLWFTTQSYRKGNQDPIAHPHSWTQQSLALTYLDGKPLMYSDYGKLQVHNPLYGKICGLVDTWIKNEPGFLVKYVGYIFLDKHKPHLAQYLIQRSWRAYRWKQFSKRICFALMKYQTILELTYLPGFGSRYFECQEHFDKTKDT